MKCARRSLSRDRESPDTPQLVRASEPQRAHPHDGLRNHCSPGQRAIAARQRARSLLASARHLCSMRFSRGKASKAITRTLPGFAAGRTGIDRCGECGVLAFRCFVGCVPSGASTLARCACSAQPLKERTTPRVCASVPSSDSPALFPSPCAEHVRNRQDYRAGSKTRPSCVRVRSRPPGSHSRARAHKRHRPLQVRTPAIRHPQSSARESATGKERSEAWRKYTGALAAAATAHPGFAGLWLVRGKGTRLEPLARQSPGPIIRDSVDHRSVTPSSSSARSIAGSFPRRRPASDVEMRRYGIDDSEDRLAHRRVRRGIGIGVVALIHHHLQRLRGVTHSAAEMCQSDLR